MSDRFSNSYWSSDYTTGISSLKTQSNISLKQLHALRQVVFKYMNYYHANSQFMAGFGSETMESPLRVPYGVSMVNVEGSGGRKTQLLQCRTVSQTHRKLGDINSNDAAKEVQEGADKSPAAERASERGLDPVSDDPPVTMAVPVTMYAKELRAEATTLMSLASTIDREVLEGINDFIKHHEASIRNNVDRLDDLVNDYIATYADVEILKTKYTECQRAKEFADNEHAAKLASEAEKDAEADTSVGSVNEENTSYSNDTESHRLDTSSHSSDPESDSEGITSEFQFPLFLGPVKLKSQKELSAFLEDAMTRVETTKRSFPLPGQNPNIFSSDELCKFLTYRRPFKLNPTRLNMERFGQSLLDMKLITATSLIGFKKFKSENMWFEWSELAGYISKFGSEEGQSYPSEKTPVNSPNITPLTQRLIDQKAMNEMANQTSKKFNNMFKSMKLSILHTNYEEKLSALEQEYNEKYYDLHELKFLLDQEIFDKTQYFEKFEKMKIGLIYQSLTKLSEVVYNFSLHSTTRLHDFASTLMKSINDPSNYENDFKSLIDTFSTGIYSPSILSPENFQKNHYSTTQANNNFQNLKLQFNLYKDIPLQLQMRQTDRDSHLLSFSSLPFFIYQYMKVIESKESEPQQLREAWQAPINHQSYWRLKERIIQTINSTSTDHIPLSNESLVQQTVIEQIVELLQTEKIEILINFFKNWLLEIADSLIPCVIYDSMVQIYNFDEKEITKSTVTELIKVVSSIPRSNIISLLFILEHISVIYALSQIPSFGLSDDIPSELKSPIDKDKLKDAANDLNAMDTIGAVPFIHLIFRPSPIKSAGGLKPPLRTYNLLLQDLLNLDVRCELFNNLVNSEKVVLEKKQQEKNNLGLQKKVVIPPSPRRAMPVNINHMKSPMSLAPSDSFSLRPFRTKVTPAPSPSTSPSHDPREMFESQHRSSSGPTLGNLTPKQAPRERTSSGTFLAPAIDIEFEGDKKK